MTKYSFIIQASADPDAEWTDVGEHTSHSDAVEVYELSVERASLSDYFVRLVARIQPCANAPIQAKCMHPDGCQESAVVDCPAFFALGRWGYWCEYHFPMAGVDGPDLVNVIVDRPIDLIMEEM